ncbi:MAG: hypothetical protein KF895_05635 [Parvibaculum sp.]|nr:hypothetical protein [Parvibaculum sp.]
MANEITLERFSAIVEAYGASPARWPEAERGAAEAFAASSAEARSLLAVAGALDAALAAAPVEAPSAALVARLMAARPRAAGAAPAAKPRSAFRELIDTIWPYGSPALPTGALAASIMLGIAVGSVSEISVLNEGLTAAEETEADDRLISLALADVAWPEEWMQ